MRKLFVTIAAAGFVAAGFSTTAGRAGAAESFDGFLGGLLDACSVGGAFKSYSDAVQNRAQGRAKGAVRGPAGLGAPRAADKGDYTSVEVDAAGVFRGLALRKLRYGFGKDNGIYVIEVLFAEPPAKLRKALGAAVRSSKAKMKATFATDATTDLSFKNGAAALVCDLSS